MAGPSPDREKGSWIEARAKRAVTTRRVFPYLALTTAGIAVLTGFVVTLIDEQDFPTFGDGVWWAIVTLGTVGYGDIVPHTAWGRVIGSIVIVFGVTFISFLTAVVTSYFVSIGQEEEDERRDASEAKLNALLERVETRLAAIEAKLPPTA